VRRDRRQCRESIWEGKVQNRRSVTFETIRQQEVVRSRGGVEVGEQEEKKKTR
jgi:hypothetical protein